MSKIKNPIDKKVASLALDARNVYGVNDKSSRKAIPLRKQASHQALRRASKQPLAAVNSALDEDDLVATEAKLLSNEAVAIGRRFRKRPDEPLGVVIEAKRTGDRSQLSRKRK
ncbi:MAG: hypothetical protein JSS95_00745 [Acidobacteria bacterium]|nr:hypothetical protein [Acidobacteriota bacterium]